MPHAIYEFFFTKLGSDVTRDTRMEISVALAKLFESTKDKGKPAEQFAADCIREIKYVRLFITTAVLQARGIQVWAGGRGSRRGHTRCHGTDGRDSGYVWVKTILTYMYI